MEVTYTQLSDYLQNLGGLMGIHSQKPITNETIQEAMLYKQALSAVYPLIINFLDNYILPGTITTPVVPVTIPVPKPVSPVSRPVVPVPVSPVPKPVVPVSVSPVPRPVVPVSVSPVPRPVVPVSVSPVPRPVVPVPVSPVPILVTKPAVPVPVSPVPVGPVPVGPRPVSPRPVAGPKPDIFKMTEQQIQKYYKNDYMKPYIGFRFLVSRGCGFYDNYVVTGIGKPKGKLIKDAAVVKVNMVGEAIGNRDEIVFERGTGNWPLGGWTLKSNKRGLDKGIASDEGIIVDSYDDPRLKYISHYESDIYGTKIPTINLIANVLKNGYDTRYRNRYIVDNIIGDRIHLTSVARQDGIETEFNAVLRNNTWVIIDGDQNYTYRLDLGCFDYPYFDYPR